MTVYVVMEYDYGTYLIGVYSTREAADAVAEFSDDYFVEVIEADVIPARPAPKPSPDRISPEEAAALLASQEAMVDRAIAALRARESAPQHIVKVGNVQVATVKTD